ncbi:MAG: hypothetical protein AB7F99_19120 [Vicinamibacterales bacterium]
MAGTLIVEVDGGSEISSGDVVEFSDSTTASPPSDISLSLSASGGNITITKVAIPIWGHRIRITGGSPTNVAIGTGGTANVSIGLSIVSFPEVLTLKFDTMGSALPEHRSGCCYGLINITWNNGGADQTFKIIVRGAMKPGTGSQSVMTLADLKDRVVMGYALGSSAITGSNPLGLGWGIDTGGHIGFGNTYFAADIAKGVKHTFLHGMGGQMHPQLSPPEDDICFDPFIVAAELGLNPLWYSTWDQMVELWESLAGHGTLYCYTGSMRRRKRVIDFRAAGDAVGMIRWFWQAMSPFLKHPSIQVCCDVPYFDGDDDNPACVSGEARYEMLLCATKVLDMLGRGQIHCEPRGDHADSQWFDDAGFGRCVINHSYDRSDPSRYTDSNGLAEDDDFSDRTILRWHIDSDNQTLAWQIVQTLFGYGSHATTKIVVSLRAYFDAGNDMDDLLTEVNAVLAASTGT